MRSPTTGKQFAVLRDSGPRWTGDVELIEAKLQEPLHWRKPRRVFVNSMSDLFHEALPDEAIDRVFAVMALCPHLTFQVLTKRAERAYAWAKASNDTIEIVKPYLDPDVYQWQYPARSILDSGGIISGASDWPVSTANVFRAIYQAETRKGSEGVLDPSQDMPREAMFYAYTRNSARAMNLVVDHGG